MFSSEDLDKIKEAIAQFNAGNNNKNSKEGKDEKHKKNNNNKDCVNLTPSQLLVIAGFLSGALEVVSVTVDKDQMVQIVLNGTLKRKTQLEKIMEQIGQLPFEEVIRAIMNSSG